MKIKTILAALAVLSALGLAAVAAGCGDDDHGDHTGGGGGANAAGNATDAAFVNDMVPHHEGAIEMARLAQKEADKEEIRNLADGIIAAQESEIATLRSVQADLGDAHGGAHMSGDEHMRGMDMDADELHGAKPFDREFIDMMIPHHEGAVTMAKEELEKGENPALRKLAEDLISAQSREIAQMREWREMWYGDGRGEMSHGGHHE